MTLFQCSRYAGTPCDLAPHCAGVRVCVTRRVSFQTPVGDAQVTTTLEWDVDAEGRQRRRKRRDA